MTNSAEAGKPLSRWTTFWKSRRVGYLIFLVAITNKRLLVLPKDGEIEGRLWRNFCGTYPISVEKNADFSILRSKLLLIYV